MKCMGARLLLGGLNLQRTFACVGEIRHFAFCTTPHRSQVMLQQTRDLGIRSHCIPKACYVRADSQTRRNACGHTCIPTIRADKCP